MARGLEEGEITVNKFKTIGILPAKLSLALLSFLPCRSNKIQLKLTWTAIEQGSRIRVLIQIQHRVLCAAAIRIDLPQFTRSTALTLTTHSLCVTLHIRDFGFMFGIRHRMAALILCSLILLSVSIFRLSFYHYISVGWPLTSRLQKCSSSQNHLFLFD